MQQSSRYLAKRQAREEGYRGEIAKPERLITSSELSMGALVKHISERHIFVGEDFKVYGASQKGIGQALGRSERTIRRRLSNPVRKVKGLPSVLKRQLCQTKPEYALRDLFHKLCPNSDDLDSKRFFQVSYKNQIAVYRAACNLYVLPHVLHSCKTRKYFFNRFLHQVEVVGKNTGQK